MRDAEPFGVESALYLSGLDETIGGNSSSNLHGRPSSSFSLLKTLREAGSIGVESALPLCAVNEEWGGGDCLYCSHSTIEGKQRNNAKRKFALLRDASESPPSGMVCRGCSSFFCGACLTAMHESAADYRVLGLSDLWTIDVTNFLNSTYKLFHSQNQSIFHLLTAIFPVISVAL
jgi:hypothetical protein